MILKMKRVTILLVATATLCSSGVAPPSMPMAHQKHDTGKGKGKGKGHGHDCPPQELPDDKHLINLAFPPAKWPASKGYSSKFYMSMDPSLGGYPSPIDTGYWFEGVAPWLGQPGAGSPHHCPIDSDVHRNAKTCPKLESLTDDGPEGIYQHIPPHVSLAVLKNHASKAWMLFDQNSDSCIIPAQKMFDLIREDYPRDANGNVTYKYPKPTESGYKLEFESKAGGPHYCSDEIRELAIWPDYCPYVKEYRHPHIAFAALQQYLAHMLMPDKCGVEWDASNYPPSVGTGHDWPEMDEPVESAFFGQLPNGYKGDVSSWIDTEGTPKPYGQPKLDAQDRLVWPSCQGTTSSYRFPDTHGIPVFTRLVLGEKLGKLGMPQCKLDYLTAELPDDMDMMNLAFPSPTMQDSDDNPGTWLGSDGYVTKRYSSMDPSLGGFPSDIDVRYVFYGAAPFFGQPGAGGPHNCPVYPTADQKTAGMANPGDPRPCPKQDPGTDDFKMGGPGHIPPHIALAALKKHGLAEAKCLFDKHSKTPCDVPADKLLELIRRDHPRGVKMPGPAATDPPYLYEFENEIPDRGHSGPHYCSGHFYEDNAANESRPFIWPDFCPYVPNYRHPHVAFAAVQQYLAHMVDPDQCSVEWEDYGMYPPCPSTGIHFPDMETEFDLNQTVDMLRAFPDDILTNSDYFGSFDDISPHLYAQPKFDGVEKRITFAEDDTIRNVKAAVPFDNTLAFQICNHTVLCDKTLFDESCMIDDVEVSESASAPNEICRCLMKTASNNQEFDESCLLEGTGNMFSAVKNQYCPSLQASSCDNFSDLEGPSMCGYIEIVSEKEFCDDDEKEFCMHTCCEKFPPIDCITNAECGEGTYCGKPDDLVRVPLVGVCQECVNCRDWKVFDLWIHEHDYSKGSTESNEFETCEDCGCEPDTCFDNPLFQS